MNDWIAVGIPRADWLELFVLCLFVAVSTGLPDRMMGRLAGWERAVLARANWILGPPWRGALAIGVLAGGMRLLLLPFMGIPYPVKIDEFCYLLASDTFAHGRLTNPPHKLWMFFESLNVLQLPTYSSKYPPAQGLVMAAGQVIAGHPWFGVWLSMTMACALFYWTLAQWAPRRWALFGAILAISRWGIFSYWMNSYWGGAVAAIGGCLALGSIPRLRRRPGISGALLLGAGLAILAATRPYEGAVLGSVIVGTWALRKPEFRAQILPLAAMLAVLAGAMAYFNWRVTGEPLRMPYAAYERQYATVPLFIFLPERPAPNYRHPVIAAFLQRDVKLYQDVRTLSGFLRRIADELMMLFRFFAGPALLIPLTALFWIRQNRRMRWLASALAILFLGMVITAWNHPHYAAPATILMLLLFVGGLRILNRWEYWGPLLVRAILFACVFRAAYCFRLAGEEIAARPDNFRCCVSTGSPNRIAVTETLEAIPGKHLVIVEYGPQQPDFIEYVYNLADIDGQRIVWARSMDPQTDRQLLDYYRGRQIWLMRANAGGYDLRPYEVPATSPSGRI